MREIRGAAIGMIFQDPATALHPMIRVGDQVAETLRTHRSLTRSKRAPEQSTSFARSASRLPRSASALYPHEMSGGMCQRVIIAMAIACSPRLLLADEPTTALDVTVQAQILELLRSIARDGAMSMILITHDLGVVARCDESRRRHVRRRHCRDRPDRSAVRRSEASLYSQGLLRSIPRLDSGWDEDMPTIAGAVQTPTPSPGCRFAPRCPLAAEVCREAPPLRSFGADHQAACWRGFVSEAIVEAIGLALHYKLPGKRLLRASTASILPIGRGATLGLVGESGSGKSTLGRALVGLQNPSGGEVRFEGEPVAGADARKLVRLRRQRQIVFQDPSGALNPRMTFGDTIVEHLRVQGFSRAAARERAGEVLTLAGLSRAFLGRYPHEVSGGQRQRAVIARAISTDPAFIVADEPVSALDVSTRAQIMNLLRELQRRSGLTMLFISHDLSIVAHMCREVAVMYLGRVVELAPRATCSSPLGIPTRPRSCLRFRCPTPFSSARGSPSF